MARHVLDLDEVRRLLDQGMDRDEIARKTRQAPANIDHAWSVITGLPLPHDPAPEVIERITGEYQRTWSEEQWRAARLGIPRDSSSLVPVRRRRKRHEETKTEDATWM